MNAPSDHTASMDIMFHGGKEYTIRMWVVVPTDQPWLEESCLQVITSLFQQRVLPLSQARDKNGDRFLRSNEGTDSVFSAHSRSS